MSCRHLAWTTLMSGSAALAQTQPPTEPTQPRSRPSFPGVARLFPLGEGGQATTVQERRIDSEQYSNELQINYSDRFVSAVLGGFHLHERQRPIENVGLARRNGMASNIAVLQAAGIDLDEAFALCGYSPDTVGGGSAVIARKRVCIRRSGPRRRARAIVPHGEGG